MKRAKNLANRTIQAAVLLALALLMVVLFRAASGNGGLLAQSGPTQPSSTTLPSELPYPPPVTGRPPDQPTPSIISSGTPDQTATIHPTLTPLPTPTVRPGPTATGIPVPTLAKDPSGVIWYTTVNEVPISSEASTFTFSNSALRIDEGGEAHTATDLNAVSNEIDLLLENKAYAIYPSRNWDYLVAMKFSEPGGKPYVFDMKTMKLSHPLADFAPGQFLGWHPDGRRFLFFVDGGGPWLVDAASSEITQSGEVRQLISGYDPIWSPDGSKLAFISNRGGAQEIWLINFDGSGLIQLTSDGQPKGSLQVWLQEIEK